MNEWDLRYLKLLIQVGERIYNEALEKADLSDVPHRRQCPECGVWIMHNSEHDCCY